MGQERVGPRKPATKFPHLRKQMAKNALPFGAAARKRVKSKFGSSKFGQSSKGDAAK